MKGNVQKDLFSSPSEEMTAIDTLASTTEGTEALPEVEPESDQPLAEQMRESSSPSFDTPALLLDPAESSFSIHLDVLIALLPILVWSVYLYGARPIALTAVSITASLGFELLCRHLFKRTAPLDLTPVITGAILAFGMPASAPLWLPAVGALIAILPIRQLFGGTGRNLINPAAFALVTLHLFFPQYMLVLPAAGQKLSAFAFSLPRFEPVGSTALETVLSGFLPEASLGSVFFGLHAGRIGETSAFLLLAAGTYLLCRKILRPSLPLFYLLSLAVLVYLYPTLSAASDMIAIQGVLHNIFGSNTLLVAIFLLGDPVTTPKSERGIVAAGLIAGIVTFLLRIYVDVSVSALAAVLVVNILTPFLDSYLRPTVFGGRQKKK